jgi:hypothetical protein
MMNQGRGRRLTIAAGNSNYRRGIVAEEEFDLRRNIRATLDGLVYEGVVGPYSGVNSQQLTALKDIRRMLTKSPAMYANIRQRCDGNFQLFSRSNIRDRNECSLLSKKPRRSDAASKSS